MIQDEPELWIIVSNSLDLRTFSTPSATRDQLDNSGFRPLSPRQATCRPRYRLSAKFSLLIPRQETCRGSPLTSLVDPKRLCRFSKKTVLSLAGFNAYPVGQSFRRTSSAARSGATQGRRRRTTPCRHQTGRGIHILPRVTGREVIAYHWSWQVGFRRW